MRHPRDLAADPHRVPRDGVPLSMHLDDGPQLRDLCELRVRREPPDDLPDARRRDPPRDRPVRVQVRDDLDWDGRRARSERVGTAVAEEGEEAAAVVRVPVREHDALDELDGRLEGLDVADDRARVGAGVEERVAGRGAFRLRLLLGVTRSVSRSQPEKNRDEVLTISAENPWAPVHR